MGISNFVNVDLRSTVHGWNLNPTAHNMLVWTGDAVVSALAKKLIDAFCVRVVARTMGFEPSKYAMIVRVTEADGEEKYYRQQLTPSGRLSDSKELITLNAKDQKEFMFVNAAKNVSGFSNFIPYVSTIQYLFSEKIGFARTGEFSIKKQAGFMCAALVAAVAVKIFKAVVIDKIFELDAKGRVKYLIVFEAKHPRVASVINQYVVPAWNLVPQMPSLFFIACVLQMKSTATTFPRSLLESDVPRAGLILGADWVGSYVGSRFTSTQTH